MWNLNENLKFPFRRYQKELVRKTQHNLIKSTNQVLIITVESKFSDINDRLGYFFKWLNCVHRGAQEKKIIRSEFVLHKGIIFKAAYVARTQRNH